MAFHPALKAVLVPHLMDNALRPTMGDVMAGLHWCTRTPRTATTRCGAAQWGSCSQRCSRLRAMASPVVGASCASTSSRSTHFTL